MKKRYFSSVDVVRRIKRKRFTNFEALPDISESEARDHFDAQYYLSNNPDVMAAGIDAFDHFVMYGWKEGRSPSALINLTDYLDANPDLRNTKENPFVHFVKRFKVTEEFRSLFGSIEVFRTVFDESYYRLNYPEVENGGVDAFDHFVEFGWRRGNAPAEGIDVSDYLKKRNDLLLKYSDPFSQYLKSVSSKKRFSDIYGDVKFLKQRFDRGYYLSKNKDVASSGVDPFAHFIAYGWREHRKPYADFDIKPQLKYQSIPSKSRRLRASVGKDRIVLTASEVDMLFDEPYYLQKNPDVAKTGMDAFKHFMTFGWLEFRNPSASFDLIWYTQFYLKSDWSINPLEHFHKTGKALGYSTSPPTPIVFSPPHTYSKQKKKIKRICLFAAYDRDGLIDDVVVEYIAAVSKFADVYFLSDCHVSPAELAKVEPYTKGAWAHRHGLYDFGSWSKLAQHYVGWGKIDSYDELMLVNDSAFLLGNLENVFLEMDTKSCDWWGLQATKGTVRTFGVPGNSLKEKTHISQIKSNFLSRFEGDALYDFHVGSYFVVYRKPVKSEKKFKDLLNNVKEEKAKINIIRKYEIGITRFLISLGHEFEIFEPYVYPFQPIYTEESFQLVGRGFPLLKKYHLIENHYNIADLFNWETRLNEVGVTKDLKPYVDNLRRTGNAERIYHRQDTNRLALNPKLSATQLLAKDQKTPKYKDWWVFPVCAHSHQFNDNVRALFEYVKNDASIKKIVLTRSRSIQVEGDNVHVLPLNSAEGQFYLLRSKNIFLKHSVASNIGVNLSKSLHAFHNLWHGIPLKRIGYCSIDLQDRLGWLAAENRLFTSVISASKIDQLAMTASYWPLTVNDIWLTGLPRHDLIMMPNEDLPCDMQREVKRVRDVLNGRKLIIFAPTFRLDQDEGYYKFSLKEIDALRALLKSKGYVLGIREHMADISRQYSSQLTGECFVDLSASIFPNVEVLMKEAIALVTDYSSIFIDFLVTGKPVISFAYDYEHYLSEERGLFYDLDWCFPGTIAQSAQALFSALSEVENVRSDVEIQNYDQRRKIFIDNVDGDNCQRLYNEIIALDQKNTSLFEIENVNPLSTILFDFVFVFDRGHEITARYRIFNLVPELRKMGLRCRILYSDELTSSLAQSCSVLVFSRVSFSERLLDVIHAHKLIGKKFIFDIDDLMFDEDLLEEVEYYSLRPEMHGEIRNTSRGYSKLMLEADMVTVTTSSLVSHVKSRGLEVLKIPNTLSSALITRYPDMDPEVIENEIVPIKVCYLSGTKTHGKDFKLVRDVAKMVSAHFSHVEFHVVGGVSYDEATNEQLLQGWVVHEKMNYEQMHEFLSTMDINLCPLVENTFNDSKSELKFFEAALHGVPTIASPSKTYLESIVTGENGFIASSEYKWVQFLTELVENSEKRTKMGQLARKSALSKFSASEAAKTLALSLHLPIRNSF